MLKFAFKEWAVICRALAEGRQALILRKGGIAEDGGAFRLEHTRFWLLPTYVHQQSSGIKPEAIPLLREAEAERPRPGIIRLSHFAEVAGVYHFHDMVGALRIRQLHLWSDETVHARFTYRQPGLFVMPVRIYQATQALEIPDSPAYAGCRSWVELERELPTTAATPILSDAAFQGVIRELDSLLKPTAFA
jgi:hypothetical protein